MLGSLVNQSISNASNSNIIKPQQLMPMECHVFVFWLGEGEWEKRIFSVRVHVKFDKIFIFVVKA
jgi:hypothetical protein